MRACVVGNGPSAARRGAEVDACDFVVRCTWFPLMFPDGGAGRRLDAWAWFGSTLQSGRMGGAPEGGYEVWFTLPLSRCSVVAKGHAGDLVNAVRLAGARPISVVTEERWDLEARGLSALSERPWCAPTTGLTAVDMALARSPDELLLVGFDATVPGRPGWGDARPVSPWRSDAGGHDLLAGKRALYELLEGGRWLGRPCRTKLIWPDAPELPAPAAGGGG